MLQELYEQYKDTFSKSDHKLIQYLLRNEEQLQYLTSEELSAHTGISPATVSRFWKKIGFQNLKELKIKQRIQDTATPSSRLTSALKRFEETASLTEDLKMHFGNNTAKTLDRMIQHFQPVQQTFYCRHSMFISMPRMLPADWHPFFVIAQDDWGSSLFS